MRGSPTEPSCGPRRAPALAAVASVLIGCAALSPFAAAQKPPEGSAAPAVRLVADAADSSWSTLSPAQRNALAPLQREWPQIPADNKQKWLEVAARYPGLPEAERKRMQARMSEWARMSPQERAQARLRFQQARKLSPQERSERWNEYQALPPEQRQHLAAPPAPPPAAEREALRERPLAKSNTVPAPLPLAPSRTVAPTIVQAKPGATTNLMSRQPAPPSHQQPGLPKITTTPGFVDSNTLLPRRGSQGAAARTPEAPPLPPAKSP